MKSCIIVAKQSFDLDINSLKKKKNSHAFLLIMTHFVFIPA